MISLIPLDTNKKLNISFAIIELIIIISVLHGTRHFIWNICMHGHISWKFEIKFQAFKQSSLYMKTCQFGLHLSLCILTIIVNYLVWMKSIQVGIDLYSFEKICVNLRSSEAIPQLTSIYQITWTLQCKTNITQYY